MNIRSRGMVFPLILPENQPFLYMYFWGTNPRCSILIQYILKFLARPMRRIGNDSRSMFPILNPVKRASWGKETSNTQGTQHFYPNPTPPSGLCVKAAVEAGGGGCGGASGAPSIFPADGQSAGVPLHPGGHTPWTTALGPPPACSPHSWWHAVVLGLLS